MSEDIWKSLRAANIGGSEVAALFGESPYLTYYKLWHTKRGNLEAPNLDDNERVQAGKFMEKGALDWYNSKYGTAFYQPFEYVRHAAVKGIGCTPDAYDAQVTCVMAQVKIVDYVQFKLKWEADGDQITKAPLDILLQVQHELECRNYVENHLIVVVGGNKLYRMVCKRDRDIGMMIINEVDNFWHMDTPPEPDFERDGDAILELRKRLPEKEFENFTWDKNLYKLLRTGLKKKVEKDKAQDALDAINAEIIYIIENCQHVRCGDMLVSLPTGRKTPKITSEKETI